MSTQNTLEQDHKREYPLYRTVRLRKDNIVKIKARTTRYGESFDDIVAKILDQLQAYEIKKKRSIIQ
jgi:hypothetical protein